MDGVVIDAGGPSSLAASGSNCLSAGSPRYHGYQGEIPAGWRALSPVLYPDPGAPDRSDLPVARAGVNSAFRRFQAGLLMCRQEADGQEALREFLGAAPLAAALLTPDGQYQQAGPVRPAFGVLPLATPSSSSTDRSGCAEYLVLVPLICTPVSQGDSFAPMRLFVDGLEVVGLGISNGHVPVWPGKVIPDWWHNTALRAFLTRTHRKLRLIDVHADARRRFGDAAPSRSALHRYWQLLDRLQATPDPKPTEGARP